MKLLIKLQVIKHQIIVCSDILRARLAAGKETASPLPVSLRMVMVIPHRMLVTVE